MAVGSEGSHTRGAMDRRMGGCSSSALLYCTGGLLPAPVLSRTTARSRLVTHNNCECAC